MRPRRIALALLLSTTGGAAAEGDPDRELAPLCTDRPTKSNNPCTVDEGHIQYEADIANGTFTHQGGVTTDSWLFLNPTVKYGLTDKIDVEANISPLAVLRTNDRTGQRTLTGVGDLYLRGKVAVLDGSELGVQATILPFVKAPTARRGIGNKAWEGGVIVPLQVKLNDQFTLLLDPEFDAAKNANDDGRHLAMNQLVNIAYAASDRVTLYGELFGGWNYDPAGTVRQATLDFAAAWLVRDRLQLDVGVNIGLNHQTPNTQAYIGISQKF